MFDSGLLCDCSAGANLQATTQSLGGIGPPVLYFCRVFGRGFEPGGHRAGVRRLQHTPVDVCDTTAL